MRTLRRALRLSGWWMVVAAVVRWFADPVNGPHRRATARAWLARASAYAADRIDQQRHPASARRLTALSGWAALPETRAGQGKIPRAVH